MNSNYGTNFDNYKQLGVKKLRERAKLLRNNKEFAKKNFPNGYSTSVSNCSTLNNIISKTKFKKI